METIKKFVKKQENIENKCPLTSKRIKLSSVKTLKSEEIKSRNLCEMGISMLEEDSSSSSSATAISTTVTTSAQIHYNSRRDENDENSNTSSIVDNIEVPSSSVSFISSAIQEALLDPTTNTPVDNIKLVARNPSHFLNQNETSINDLSTTLSPPSAGAASNYRNTGNNSGIEIYVDSNNKNTDKVHKKFHSNNNNSMHSKGRSPLAIVTCNSNNNYNNNNTNSSVTVVTTTDSSILSDSPVLTTLATSTLIPPAVKKQNFAPSENFFLYRDNLRQKYNTGKDPFKRLSDEMVLQIFQWLPKKALMRCSLVCKRFNQLSQDESLWTRLDLANKTLCKGALEKIVIRGVVILRLAQAEMTHPVFEPDGIETIPDYKTKLQYLDLSMAVITKPSLKMLLSKCKQLKKLSLEHVNINDEICYEIAKNTNLEALNLTMCEGIESWSLKTMMIELKNLHSLNISWTSLSVESVKALVDNITPNLLRLNIAGCRKAMFDSHLETLSKRCPGLLELDISDNTVLTSAAINIICNFKDLEYLSLSRCYGISAAAYINLSKLPSLSFIDLFGLLSDTALQALQSELAHIGINKFIYSSVARPTVGSRRTSIWGLRTREFRDSRD